MSVSEKQAEQTRSTFIEDYEQGNEEPGLVVREEETHALLELHYQLTNQSNLSETEELLLEHVEKELSYRDQEPEDPHRQTSIEAEGHPKWEDWKTRLRTV